MKAVSFMLVSGPLGLDQIVLDGEDVTDQVLSVQVQSQAGKPTALILALAGDGKITGEGIVYLQSPGNDPLRRIAELDPKEIDTEAMNRLEWGGEGTLTAVILEIIKERISGP